MSNEKLWPFASPARCSGYYNLVLADHLPTWHLSPSWSWHLTNNIGPTHITLVTAICSVHRRFDVFRPLYMACKKCWVINIRSMKTDPGLMDVAQLWHRCGVKIMFMWLAKASGHSATVYLPLMDDYWLGLLRTFMLYCVTQGVWGFLSEL